MRIFFWLNNLFISPKKNPKVYSVCPRVQKQKIDTSQEVQMMTILVKIIFKKRQTMNP